MSIPMIDKVRITRDGKRLVLCELFEASDSESPVAQLPLTGFSIDYPTPGPGAASLNLHGHYVEVVDKPIEDVPTQEHTIVGAPSTGGIFL